MHARARVCRIKQEDQEQ